MAAKYLVAGGTGNWNSTTNWSDTDGGASGANFPVAGDTVNLNSNSGATNITVNTGSACASIVASGTYTGTLTFNSTLTVTSTVTFISGMTIAGTAGSLTCTGTATLTAGSKTLTCALALQGAAATYTIADNWVVDGLLTLGQLAATTTFTGGNTITGKAGLTISGTTATIAQSGTSPTISLDGTGAITAASGTTFRLNLTFTSGTITLPANSWQVNTGTFTYVGGTIVTTSNTLTIIAATTFNTNGMTWNSITVTGTTTITLLSDLSYSNLLSNAASVNTVTWTGAFTVRHTGASGGYTFGSTNLSNGTGSFSMEGSGNITGTAGGETRNNFTVNTAGTYTFVTAWGYDTGTFTWTAGTALGSVPLNVQVSTTTTFTGTSNINWSSITFTGAAVNTVTLSDSLKCSGLLSLGNGTNAYTINGGNIYTSGGYRYNGTTASVIGSTVINLVGTGTVDAPNATSGRTTNKIVVNAPGGTITFDGTSTNVPYFDLSQFVYTAGKVVTDAGTWSPGPVRTTIRGGFQN